MKLLFLFLFLIKIAKGDSNEVAQNEVAENEADENTNTNSNYGIDVYECDQNFRALDKEHLQTKKRGKVYRVCLVPNNFANADGVGIKNVTTWEWETNAAHQYAIIDNVGQNGLSEINCRADGSVCAIDTMLTADFHVDPGSILGKGEASLLDGTVSSMEFRLFPFQFNIVMKNTDGSVMNKEETLELMKQVEEHNARVQEQQAEILPTRATGDEL